MALGPVVLPADMVLLLATVVLALVAAKLLHKRLGADVEPLIWRVLVLSLLATRLGFVLEFAALYADAPLEVLNVRDGGWEPVAGWAAAWAFTAWLAWRRPLQRRALGSVLLVATAVWWGGGWALQQTSGGAPAPRLPDIALTTLELREQPLARFAGQPVVLNLWASWCGPCQREMPTLQRAQQRYPGVQFVFANQGESVEKVQRYLALKGLALDNVLLDRHGQVARHFQQRALPTTFFFDADGTLVDTRTGELSDATLAQRLARWPEAAAAPAAGTAPAPATATATPTASPAPQPLAPSPASAGASAGAPSTP